MIGPTLVGVTPLPYKEGGRGSSPSAPTYAKRYLTRCGGVLLKVPASSV